MVGFRNKRGGINTFAVEVKATEKPPVGGYRLGRSLFDRLVGSNVPVLLVVADVKRSELYYGWLGATETSVGQSVTVSVTKLDDKAKLKLRKEFSAMEEGATLSRA